MSKTTSNTRGKILDRALELFNERGIEYVGMRELAADLEMRVSNISYYFPTKDDLVFQISQDLSASNAKIIVYHDEITMQLFLSTLQKVLRNQLRFRCMFLSFVHLMKQNKLIASSYKNTQKTRHNTIRANLENLVMGGFMVADQLELDFLTSNLSLISRFWISEAAISLRKSPDEELIQHYLVLVTRLLMPYSTKKGRLECEEFLLSSQHKM
jgi:AcrR family transcriptional regulator